MKSKNVRSTNRSTIWTVTRIALIIAIVVFWAQWMIFYHINERLRQTEWSFGVVGVLLLLVLYVIITARSQWDRQRRTEQTLWRMQERLAYAQRIARIGSWEWDVIENVHVWSAEMYRIFDVNPQTSETTQKELLTRIHPDDRADFIRQLDAALRGKVYDMEYRIVRSDGEVRIIHAHVEVVSEDDVVIQLVGTIQDITERKQTDDLLLKSEKLSAVGELAAGVAHEIRNPLTALKGFIQLMPSVETEAMKRYLNIMRDEVERMEMIVGELLVLAKPQAIHFTTEDIATKLEEVLTVLNTRAIMNNVRIETDFDRLLPRIRCESNQLKQVFVNLIQNAMDAMPEGGHLHISIRRETEFVKIQFTDTGYGIEPNRIAKLGEPFYTTKEKGTGLGLMVTQKIIQNHQGRFEVTSQVGQGTTVSVLLPV